MQRRSIPASLALALALALPLAAAASGATEPTVRHQAALENVTMPGTFDMIMRVLDFPAGAGAAPHTHAGPVLNIVLEGAITLRRPGTETTFATGQDWVDPPIWCTTPRIRAPRGPDFWRPSSSPRARRCPPPRPAARNRRCPPRPRAPR